MQTMLLVRLCFFLTKAYGPINAPAQPFRGIVSVEATSRVASARLVASSKTISEGDRTREELGTELVILSSAHELHGHFDSTDPSKKQKL